MKKLLYQVAHAILTLLDMIAGGLSLPWEYKESQKRRMREKINGKR